jgi:methylthioribose-1-phosphate isomerase
MNVETFRLHEDGTFSLLDQRLLPGEETYLHCESWQQVAEAIETMVVRGAPAIGVTAALGVALAATNQAKEVSNVDEMRPQLDEVLERLSRTRPTAVNLFWAIERMRKTLESLATTSPAELATRLTEEAHQIQQEDLETCARMGELGDTLVPEGARILTHCNTGALATAGIGTALGVIRTAAGNDKRIHVWADETRPWLQGARLTTWECMKEEIPVSLIPDSAAADFMRRGEVDLVLVGADRIAANGDTANKIGTYSVAVAAHHHGIPFYVVAPTTTVDLSLPDGSKIPIEERSPEEVTSIAGTSIAPEGVEARNPAFDVTPSRLISAIVTEAGIARPDYVSSLAKLCKT